jgi:hypothetical protein
MDSSSSRTKCITERLKTSRRRDAAGDTRGFLLSAGIFTKIDVPGALDLAFPTGISANGEIVAQSYVGGFSNFNPVLGAWPRQKGRLEGVIWSSFW